MTLLDMRTVLFNYAITDIVCLVVIVLLWLQNRQRIAGTYFWVFFSLCQTLALLLIILRGSIPDWASMMLSSTLLMTGALLAYMGLCYFAGKKVVQVHNVILVALFSLVHLYFSVVQPDLIARILNISLGLLIISFQAAWFALYGAPAGMRPLTKGVGVIFALYGLISIVRIIGCFTGGHDNDDLFQAGSFDVLIIVSYQILFILLTYALALMFNKRLITDVTTQEEKFFKAFRSSPYALILSRISDGEIIETNDGFETITGFPGADVKGRTTFDIRLWTSEEDRSAALRELLETGRVQGRELQSRKKSGEIITVLFSAELLTINNEKYALSSMNDVTARKRAEEALKDSNAYLERLNNALADAVFVVKFPERVVEYLNDAAVAMFGHLRQDVLGKNSLIFYPDQEGYLRSGNIFQEAIQQAKNLVSFETILKRKDETTFPALFTATFLKEKDSITKFIVIVQDITVQKRDNDTIRRLNEELEKRVTDRTKELNDTQIALLNLVDDLNQSTKDLHLANQSLEAVNKELASFSYSVSHDLRAPLRSIDGFSAALLEDYSEKLDAEGKNYLERIRRATRNMTQLIDDLLNLSRVTKAEFYRQEFNLSSMVRGIAEAEQQKNPLNNLTMDIQEGIIVRADQRLLNIAMTNLLDNAWKFSAKNEHPHIQFGSIRPNDETVIFIRDNGAGFDMAYVGKIFDAFQRLHKADEFSGTGIGLATVRRIINRHGGRIWTEGEVGKGAVFFFTLGG